MTPQTGLTSERHPITQPIRSFISIGISIVVVILLLGFLGWTGNTETESGQASLALFFQPANKVINLFILSLLAIGIVLILFELFTLSQQVTWLGVLQERAQQNDGQADVSALPPMPNQLLAPVRALFADQDNIGNLNTQSSKAVIDAISSRVEERRELVRWLIQTLILSGLIGTFWGLFGTISQIGNLVGSLQSVTSGSGGATQGFGSLIQTLDPVLSSMGVAFSSSLLGLAGSMLLGFFELQAGGAQNRFVEELEDWLYSITKMRTAFSIPSETGDYDFDNAGQQAQRISETFANSFDRLCSKLNSTVDEHAQANKNIVDLIDNITIVSKQHTIDQRQLEMLCQNAANFGPLMERLSEQTDAILARDAYDAGLAQELKTLAAGNETVTHLTQLSQASQQTLTILEKVANSLDVLNSSIQSSESDRAVTNHTIIDLAERVRDLAERHNVDQQHLEKLSQNAAYVGPLMERVNEQTNAVLARDAHDAELAQELKALAAGNETVPHLTHLSHEIERLSHLVSAQTKMAQQLSDRDAQNLRASLQDLGQVIAQATEHASHQNATIVVQAIQDVSQDASQDASQGG